MERSKYQDKEGEMICECKKRHPPIIVWLNKNDTSLRCYCEKCVPENLTIRYGGCASVDEGYEKYYKFE